MNIQHKHWWTNTRKSSSRWYRLALLLVILSLVLAACGGSTDDADTDSEDTDGGDTATDTIDATDKGVLTYTEAAEDTITAEAAHSYQFTGTSGENILIRIEATGSTFFAPYVYLYGPDNTLIANNDTENNSRSKRLQHTLEADGSYTVVVQVVNDIGAGNYMVIVEQEE